MEKRFLLFIFLSLAILTVYQSLVVKPVPKPVPGATVASGATGTRSSTTSTTAPAAVAPIPQPTEQAAPPPPSADVPALVGETSEREVRVETRDVIAVFTNRGARLKSWRLKHYFDQDRQPQELVVDLPSQPLPFTLRTADEAETATLADALYLPHGSDNAFAAGPQSAPVDLGFTYRDASGLHVTKDFHFDPSG